MYLTRMKINPARRGAAKLLASPQAMHAAVQAAFPDTEAQTRDGARVLWRLDRASRHSALLYVSSPDKPDLTHLVEQAGWPTVAGGWESRPYGRLLDFLDAGQRWAFRLTANPTRCGRRKPGDPTQHFGHVTVAQQTDWLLQRGNKLGFSVLQGDGGQPELVVNESEMRTFDRGGSPRPVTIRTVTFDGFLEVTDPQSLRTAMTAGIGRAKAYGCGLLTLAPVS